MSAYVLRPTTSFSPARLAVGLDVELDYQDAYDSLLCHLASMGGGQRVRRLLELLDAVALRDCRGLASRALLANLPEDQPLVARRICYLLEDPRVSEPAARALVDFLGVSAHSGDEHALERFILRALRRESDVGCILRALQCYVRFAVAPHRLLSGIAINEGAPMETRQEAIRLLAGHRNEQTLRVLASLFLSLGGAENCDGRLRWQSAVAIAAHGTLAATHLLRDFALTGPGDRRVEATRALGRCRGGEVRGDLDGREVDCALMECARAGLGIVRREAITALMRRRVPCRQMQELLGSETSVANRQLLEDCTDECADANPKA